MIRIALVSSHPALGNGLGERIARQPEFAVEQLASAEEARERLADLDADLFLIDPPLADESGFELCLQLSQLARPRRSLLYAAGRIERLQLAAWLAGAEAVVDKRAPEQELFAALREAARGVRVLKRPAPVRLRELVGELEPAETSIFGMRAYGLPLDQISRILRIDPLEVERMLSAWLARLAHEGLAEPPGPAPNRRTASVQPFPRVVSRWRN
jgi:DNA-binding NarL/FixJ family response regulator